MTVRAEPIFGNFADAAQHGSRRSSRLSEWRKTAHYKERGALRRNRRVLLLKRPFSGCNGSAKRLFVHGTLPILLSRNDGAAVPWSQAIGK